MEGVEAEAATEGVELMVAEVAGVGREAADREVAEREVEDVEAVAAAAVAG